MRALLLSVLLTLGFNISAETEDTHSRYTLYLIRHAEKQPDGSRDPVLTAAGKYRSEQLAKWFQGKGLEDVWSSDYRRTRDTAKPLLVTLGLKMKIYDPADQSVLVSQLKDNKKTALIVGHSNTIPALARLLCNCTIADMEETEHDRLIVISVYDDAVLARTLQQSLLVLP